MSEMRGALADNVGEKKPRSGHGRWWLVLGVVVLGLGVILEIVSHLPANRYSASAKQADAKASLGAIFTSQVAYFGENNTYAGGNNCFELIGWSPDLFWGEGYKTKYNYYCGAEVIPCTKPGCDRCINTKFPPAISSRGAFTIYAVGNVDNDANCDVWSMRDNKELKNDYNDVGD